MLVKTIILDQLCSLEGHFAIWEETVDNLSIVGELSTPTFLKLVDILEVFTTCQISIALAIDSNAYDLESLKDLEDEQVAEWPKEWVLNLDKGKLFEDSLNTEFNKLFVRNEAFILWANKLSLTQTLGCNFNSPLTIFVNKLKAQFGGPSLKFVPANLSKLSEINDYLSDDKKWPDEQRIRETLRIKSGDNFVLNPYGLAIIGGDRNIPEALPFIKIYFAILSLCMAQEIYVTDNHIRTVIQGSRSLDLKLLPEIFNVKLDCLDALEKAFLWSFKERPETRKKLITDRLSIDIVIEDSSLAENMQNHIKNAYKQAEERYGFVILERNDVYSNELRDVMKDVRTQADLYANKVRDLVNVLLRDVLAVLFLIGVSLSAKFNNIDPSIIINSNQLYAFFKILAIYFIVSIALQISSHARDIYLTHKEGIQWLGITHEYLLPSVVEENFNKPLQKRICMFWIFAMLSVIIYLAIAIISWNAESLASKYLPKPVNNHAINSNQKETIIYKTKMLNLIFEKSL